MSPQARFSIEPELVYVGYWYSKSVAYLEQLVIMIYLLVEYSKINLPLFFWG